LHFIPIKEALIFSVSQVIKEAYKRNRTKFKQALKIVFDFSKLTVADVTFFSLDGKRKNE